MKLVNVGSLCIDFVYSVPQLPMAGETLAATARNIFAGGKGLNQSIAAARDGCQVIHYGAVGPDGEMLLKMLRENGVDTKNIKQIDVPSGHAIINVDEQGQNAIVISGGANQQLDETYCLQAINILSEGDWLLLQNETNNLSNLIEAGFAAKQEAKSKLALNLAPANASVRNLPISKLDLLIVNEQEASVLAQPQNNKQNSRAIFDSLQITYPGLDIVMTLGGEGLFWYDSANQQSGILGSFDVRAVDETAAGDAFVGYLMAALVQGQSLSSSLIRASAAGALTVTKPGAAPAIAYADEVDALLKEPLNKSRKLRGSGLRAEKAWLEGNV